MKSEIDINSLIKGKEIQDLHITDEENDTPDGSVCDDCFSSCYFKCADCGEVVKVDDAHLNADSENICEDCAENYSTCEWCGDVVNTDDLVSVGDHYWCESCADSHASECMNCGDLFPLDEMDEDSNGDCLCSRCRDRYVTCDDCGVFVHEDDCHYNDDDGCCYCDNCYDPDDEDGLMEHDDMPSLNFHKRSYEENEHLYMGIEIEMDNGHNRRDAVHEFNRYSDYIFCKSDGSLSDRGIEVVTHPSTLEYHLTYAPLKEIIGIAHKYGYKSHNTDCCGLHVHMSKRAFGSDRAERDARLAKLVYIVEKFWDQMVVFSRRDEHALNSWARRYGLDYRVDTIESGYNKACCRGSRYFAVNLTNSNTVEIRLFRGTLNENTIRATLQFCRLMYDLTIFDITVLQKMTWPEFKTFGNKYPELVQYFEQRGI